jgi:hypothetical protein
MVMKSITRELALRSVDEGWASLINEAYDEFEKDDTVFVDTVKEKFGGLRIYIDGGKDPDHLEKLIDQLEQRSFHICEKCGAPGVLRNRSWMKTWCDKHSDGAPPILPYDRYVAYDQYDLFGSTWGVRPYEY